MRWSFVFIGSALWGLVMLAAAATVCEKSVRWNEDPPYSMRQANGEIVGWNVDQVRETLRRLGCTVRLVEMPWARALAELEAGRLDILPGAVRTPERERYAHFALAGMQSRNVLFMRVEAMKSWHFSKLSDLRGSGFRLGAQIGVSYGAEYDALMQDADFARSVHRISSRRNLWLMADAQRVDGVLADEMTGRAELVQLGLQDRIKASSLSLAHAPASTAFSKKTVDAEFVERYNKASETMERDGTSRAILQRYGATP